MNVEFRGDKWLGKELILGGVAYRLVAESSYLPAHDSALVRLGRKARVYKIRDKNDASHALKVFHPSYSLMEYLTITISLKTSVSGLPGLTVCQRRVINEQDARAVGEPGLAWSILMPWIEGKAWVDILEQQEPMTRESSIAMARRSVDVLARLEGRGMAHGDVSSTNVIIGDTRTTTPIELIDVEDMYHPLFQAIPHATDGSDGYAHPSNKGRGCRNSYGDRFASCMLLTEMLTWHLPEVRAAVADTSLFEPDELCRKSRKYGLVRDALYAHSVRVGRLFDRAWESPGLAGCPTIAEWNSAIAMIGKEDGDQWPDPPPPPVKPPDPAPVPGVPLHPDIRFRPINL